MRLTNKGNNAPAIYRTTYNRADCKIGIVHLGYGAFHRAHQAIYIDDYMEKTGDLRWGIAAVNLRSGDSQNFIRSGTVEDGYVIKTTNVDNDVQMRKVRSHTSYCDWAVYRELSEELLSNSDVHLVTITVTESGYYQTGDGALEIANRDIGQELSGGEPVTVYGYLANALSKRMVRIDQPISILCCDNIRSNGHMLRDNFVTYLKATDQRALLEWVGKNVTFPCSMVDRITPRATPELVSEVRGFFGESSLDPIHAEDFTQWVLEDNFAGPVPDLTSVGVEIVKDVDPYEEAKIRILNGGHTSLAYLGALAGYHTFDQAMRDPVLRQHFDNFEKNEVLPGLQLELPFDREQYLEKITRRFCNSAIADQLERICTDGYSKMQLYIRPTLRSCLSQGIHPGHTLDCIASWYVFARRSKTAGTSVPYHEPYWEKLVPMLENGHEKALATSVTLWGDLPEIYPPFPPALVDAIERMEQLWPT